MENICLARMIPAYAGAPKVTRSSPYALLAWTLIAVIVYTVARKLTEQYYLGAPLFEGLPSSESLLPFGLVGLISWSVWASRWFVSRRYRPV